MQNTTEKSSYSPFFLYTLCKCNLIEMEEIALQYERLSPCPCLSSSKQVVSQWGVMKHGWKSVWLMTFKLSKLLLKPESGKHNWQTQFCWKLNKNPNQRSLSALVHLVPTQAATKGGKFFSRLKTTLRTTQVVMIQCSFNSPLIFAAAGLLHSSRGSFSFHSLAALWWFLLFLMTITRDGEIFNVAVDLEIIFMCYFS